ncbi:hypothetical protein GGH19_003718 [Coemansia sp. RSA 1807]|nr:hypothetical protein EV176_003307 [Coemansia sp. RSA 451]KAJ2574543.1 hypothetical protein GGH19_003718 [Coemansia sp. RSA 1807]
MNMLRVPTTTLCRCTVFQQSRPLIALLFKRAYTKLSVYSEPEHISPIELLKFLQTRDHRTEFLDEDEEMIARESFNIDRDVPTTTRLDKPKGVNEEFAQQIQSLLRPDYGTESQ